MPNFANIRVAVCICTFRRQKLLRETLRGLAKLTFRKVSAPELEIVVVDTPDDSGSAREICETACLPWPIKYVVEPRRGLTYARNRAIAEASTADFVALIDDDEVPSAQWLDEHLWAQAEFSADVVSGPALPKYAPEVANWVKDGGFFDRQVVATGTTRRACPTNNVMVGRHVFERVPKFDDAFALSGAEDTDFFLRVSTAGYKIVWSQEAAVFESVSAKRGTVVWILRREYQTGNGWIFAEAALDNRLRSWIFRFSKAWGHVLIGSANAIWRSAFLDRAAVIRYLRRASLGMGMLTALVGHRFLAYQYVPVDQGD
ncbi:MAG: glycosyltransferase family 2 protein [Candidatus Sulfotelmatobacter sp.]